MIGKLSEQKSNFTSNDFNCVWISWAFFQNILAWQQRDHLVRSQVRAHANLEPRLTQIRFIVGETRSMPTKLCCQSACSLLECEIKWTEISCKLFQRSPLTLGIISSQNELQVILFKGLFATCKLRDWIESIYDHFKFKNFVSFELLNLQIICFSDKFRFLFLNH